MEEKTLPTDGNHRAQPTDEHGNPTSEQPPVQHGESEMRDVVGEYIKVRTGKKPEDPVLLVKPGKEHLEALGNAHQVQSQKEHEDPTRPSRKRKED